MALNHKVVQTWSSMHSTIKVHSKTTIKLHNYEMKLIFTGKVVSEADCNGPMNLITLTGNLVMAQTGSLVILSRLKLIYIY